MSLMGFKSGTDIRGYGAGDFSAEKLYLSDDVVARISYAFTDWLCKRGNKTYGDLIVSVGRDSRVSGPRIAGKVAETLSALGVTVKNCSLASTPAMFMSTLDLGCDGAVQITASHHPWERNGLKFFTPDGGLEGSDISALLENAEKLDASNESHQ